MVIIMYIKEVLSSVIQRVAQDAPSAVAAFLLGFLGMLFVLYIWHLTGSSSHGVWLLQAMLQFGDITWLTSTMLTQTVMPFCMIQIRVGTPLVSIPGPLRVR